MAKFIKFDTSKQPTCKVELHAHLDGSVRLSTILELAEKKGFDLKVRTLAALLAECTVKCPSTLENFLNRFQVFMPVIIGDAEAIERMAYEFCEDVAKQGVIYSEVRYSPHLLARGNGLFEELSTKVLTPREVVLSVNRGLYRGATDFKLIIRSILCCFRLFPAWSKEVLDLCVEFKNQGVVGIDVVGDEAICLSCPNDVEVFKKAASMGIHRTVHAGEAGPALNVQTALTELLAERIGHGYHVVDDPEIYSKCLEKGVHFETCPYSSCLTGSVPEKAIKHPVVRFAEDGASFSISRDDPTIIQKTLDEEYDLLRSFGLKDVHFTRANFSAVKHCFLPEDEKKLLLDWMMQIYGMSENATMKDISSISYYPLQIPLSGDTS